MTFDLVNSTVPALDQAAGPRPEAAAALTAADNTTVTAATLSTACSNCIDVPSIGRGEWHSTVPLTLTAPSFMQWLCRCMNLYQQGGSLSPLVLRSLCAFS